MALAVKLERASGAAEVAKSRRSKKTVDILDATGQHSRPA